MERAHIVQPVGQLHQQHADIARHGEQELAQVLGGALVLGLRLDLGELGHAVDQPRDIVAEQMLDLLGCGDRVLDGVVQDRGGDRLVVEVQLGQDAGDLDRMAEIRVARRTLLRAMRVDREHIGAVEQRLVGVRVVCEDPIDQLILSQHRRTMARSPIALQQKWSLRRAERRKDRALSLLKRIRITWAGWTRPSPPRRPWPCCCTGSARHRRTPCRRR